MPRTGLEEFKEVMADYKKIYSYTLGGSAAAPTAIALTSQLGPPWPPGLALITSLTELVVMIAGFHFWFGKNLKQLNQRVIISLIFLGLSLFTYLFLMHTFVFEYPTTQNKEVRGFILNKNIKPLVQDPEFDTAEKLLEGYEYDAKKIWEPWSITIINLALIAGWLTFFVSLSIFMVSFIMYQRKKSMSPENTPDLNLLYCNGIDPDTGTYALSPLSISALAENIHSLQGSPEVMRLQEEPVVRKFAVPFGVDLEKPEEAGWAIVFHEETPQDVRDSLAPLIAQRQQQAGSRFKQLDYRKGEQLRDWYQRWGVSPGNLDPEIVPYYLLLVGPPTDIPFAFQYLLGVEYAVGRLSFDQAADYGRYALSLVAYEQTQTVKNAREIVYWGTRHPNDPATNLSTSLLITPLANGLEGATGSLKKPIHTEVGYTRRLYSADEATKSQLLSIINTPTPPALLFTASHGMALKAGHAQQPNDQGGLICQDWPGYGKVTTQHYLTAADVPDNANVRGLVAFIFACFSAGTPDTDQFLMNLGEAAQTARLAPQPFVAALPRRLLSHPQGSALAVIGHIDRAWGCSIQPLKATGAHIEVFRNTLGYILTGSPIGHALTQDFGQRYATLSTELLTAVSPTAPTEGQLSDHDLVWYWVERNDAQNYVLLGDPLARIRTELLS